MAAIKLDLPVPGGPYRSGQDVWEVRIEGLLLVLLVEAHLKGPDLEPVVAVPTTAVPVAIPPAGVVAADEAPPELGALVYVGHLLAFLHAEHHALGLVDAADPEALHVGVDPRGQPSPEKSRSRTSYGTSSFTTPRTSIADAASDAAVVTALLYDSIALSYDAMAVRQSFVSAPHWYVSAAFFTTKCWVEF
uniref:Uncharacterized protein n=1 Tax=Leersia perrieri TaxID=77586 RepID=A0A0D9V2P0_9ORYZ